MTRLLFQFISDNPFGGELKEQGIYKTFNEAVEAAIPFIKDKNIKAILANDGYQWVRIK